MSFESLRQLQSTNEQKSLRYTNYFRAKKTARNTSAMAPPEYRELYFTAVAFCRLGCQVLNERIELDSVNAETTEATSFLRRVLKANGGSDFVATAHLAAMEHGRAYLVPTESERSDNISIVQVVPGSDMVHSIGPYTRQVSEALRVFGETRQKYAYYTPETIQYIEPGPGPNGWNVTDTVQNPDGKIPVFPLVCRGDINKTFGRPEAKDAFTLQDSACRIATDLAIASATMAVPQRALLGAEAEDFVRRNADGSVVVDENGDPVPMTGDQLYTSRLLTLSDPTSKLAEFSAAQLQNFSTALNSVTRQAAAILGVPQSVFGVASDANPASGDGQRQDDARLVRRAEQLTRGFEPAWTALFEYLLDVTDGQTAGEVALSWVDPSLPNLASRADAIAKLAGVTVGDQPLYSWQELRSKLGDGQEEIDKALEQRERENLVRLLNTPVADE